MDPWVRENKKAQTEQIVQFMEETLNDLENQPHANAPKWSQTGVLVLGDFNIKAGSDEYHETLRKSNPNWIDYFETVEDHTYSLENPLVRSPDDVGRIDYIFGVPTCGGRTFMTLDCMSCEVEKQNPPLSDHYPLTIQLLPRDAKATN
jgi:endonuclease/exonuclease/phosphatase family metal-dependent hydrolase